METILPMVAERELLINEKVHLIQQQISFHNLSMHCEEPSNKSN